MVNVLVILDGASEPLGEAPTSLERARTPVLDRLASEGELSLLRTVASGLPPGSEAAIPALLGWTPPAPVDRAALEAAARGLEVDEGVWRVDVRDGGLRAGDDAVARTAAALRRQLPNHHVEPIGGHKLLVFGPEPLPPIPLHVWPRGVLPPRILDERTVVVAAPGAAAGAGRLMGAAVVTPDGATGRPDTDLHAKAAAALRALDRGAERVVVHVGGPDEASHEHDRDGKVALLERIDRELLAALAGCGAPLTICSDHNCDPATGEHDAAPVPCLAWSGEPADGGARRARFIERELAEVVPA
jgi:2,3-bisphosphoglycerate-independent phosphoglycerate mutase